MELKSCGLAMMARMSTEPTSLSLTVRSPKTRLVFRSFWESLKISWIGKLMAENLPTPNKGCERP